MGRRSSCDDPPKAGHFWLAGAREQAVPGRLTLGREGPRVELDGMLTSGMRLESVTPTEDGSALNTFVPVMGEEEALTVYGEVEKGVGTEGVTLVDSFTTSRAYGRMRHGSGHQRLQALYVVRGGHIAGEDQRFSRVRVRLDHLDEWASLSGFGQELGQDKASISFERIDVAPVSLQNGGRLELDQVLASSFDDVLGGRLTRSVWLRIIDVPPATWRELDRGLVTPLGTLLTLAVDADCPPLHVQVATDSVTDWLSVHSSGLSRSPTRPIALERMLLPLNVFGLEGVGAWLDRVETLGPLPSVIAGAVAGSPRTVEARVLELALAAEGLARRLWPVWHRFTVEEAAQAEEAARAAVIQQGEQVSAAVKAALQHLKEPSFPQRLLRLAERAEGVVPAVVGARSEEGHPSRWKTAVVGARNDIAHSLDRGWLEERRLDQYLAVMISLRWLLTAVLLLETGLPAETLADRFTHHGPYQLFLRQARKWLPRVYA